MRGLRASAAVVWAALLLLCGCGLGGSGDGGAEAGESGSQRATPSAPATQDVLSADPVATGTLVKKNAKLKVELIGLRRSGQEMVRLVLRVTALTNTPDILPAYFGAGAVADGFAVVDAAAGKRYLVVKDSKGDCLCTSGRINAAKGQPTPVYAYFPAPPKDTEAVEVVVPNMTPFDDVPIHE